MKQSLVYMLVVTKNMWSMLIIRNAELADWLLVFRTRLGKGKENGRLG